MNSLDRNRRGHSQRSTRATSVARFEDTENLHHHRSKTAHELNVRDYTMTLPASRGRHRSRINGIILFKVDCKNYYSGINDF